MEDLDHSAVWCSVKRYKAAADDLRPSQVFYLVTIEPAIAFWIQAPIKRG